MGAAAAAVTSLPLYSYCRHSTPLSAGHVFDGSPQRIRRRTPASGKLADAAKCNAFFRVLLSNQTAFATITHASLNRYSFLPTTQNFEGYIPWRSTISSLQVSFPSSPSSALMVSAHLTSSDVPQRSEEWFALRKDKLTTSTFSTALGFWSGNRRSELWHQKVFEPEEITFEAAARAAMDWGVLHESAAIERYKNITGQEVGSLGFAVHMEARSGWLGASPDGVLGCYPGGGILEVKCPFNKGKPELALPWRTMPYYYMPQVQGLMEIMDRDWVDFYCWTPNGSSLFRVHRDRAYWNLIHGILHDFWWLNVVPARDALLLRSEADVKTYEPEPKHRLTNLVIVESRKLASEARLMCLDIEGHVKFFK